MKTTGCVLDWRGSLRDWSRYHHTITNHNAIPVRGVNGEGMEFNGSTSYLDCGNDSSLNITDAFTIEAWANLTSVYRIGVVARANDGSNALYLGAGSTNKGVFLIKNAGTQKTAESPSAVATREFVYMVGVSDGTHIYYYENGVLIDTDDYIAPPTFTNNMKIGSGNDFWSAAFGWADGIIPSVKIYNRALTPLEIWNNYQVMKPYVPLSESPVAIV